MLQPNYHSWLIPYLEGSLGDAQRVELEARLAADPKLAADADTLRRITDTLRVSAASSTDHLEPTASPVWPAVRARLEAKPKARQQWRMAWSSAAGACAASLLVAALWLPTHPHRALPTPLPPSITPVVVAPAPTVATLPEKPAPSTDQEIKALDSHRDPFRPSASVNNPLKASEKASQMVVQPAPNGLPAMPGGGAETQALGTPGASNEKMASRSQGGSFPSPTSASAVQGRPPREEKSNGFASLLPMAVQSETDTTPMSALPVPASERRALRPALLQARAAQILAANGSLDAAQNRWRTVLKTAVSPPLYGKESGGEFMQQTLQTVQANGLLESLRDDLAERQTLRPKDAALGRVLAAVYAYQQNPEETRRQLSRVAYSASATGEDWYQLALAETRRGEAAASRDACRQALKHGDLSASHRAQARQWVNAGPR